MRLGGVSTVAMEMDNKRLYVVVFLILCILQVTTAQGTERRLGRVTNQFDPSQTQKDIPQGSASLAFVFDITGSMYDDLVQVIEGAARILATTLARREKPLYNYVLVPFHDPEIGPVTVTTDPIEFQQELRDLYVQGGGDCPEMSVGAIRLALQQSLPNSFIYVFTDARAKDYMLTESVLSLIQNKQSQVVFVMTGDCGNTSHDGFRAYEQIASTSSGQVFLLQKSQVNQVLNFVRVAVQSRKVNLLATDRDEGDVQKYDLPVDDALKELTISVSGAKPYIRLVNPKGEEVNEQNGLNKLLKIKKAQIVGIKEPMPGIWKLVVKSESAHTLRVTGLSSLDFVHGFSRKPTLHMNMTSRRPVKGIPTYVLLNATDLAPPGRMTKMELLNLYGERLVEVPLVLNTDHPSLYNVSGFVPPNNEFFYVKVEGIDSEGYQFWRTAPTAITVVIPGPPEVQMPETTYGFYDTRATLLCQVGSLVPYSVQWSKDGVPVGQQLFFSDPQTVQYLVESASIFSEGVYMCNASNAAGSAIAQTFLDIKEPPPSIIAPYNISATPGHNALLTCIVAYSSVDYNMTWYRFRNGEKVAITTDDKHQIFTNGSVVVKDIDDTDEGRYLCRATNEGGFNEESVYVFVNRHPVALVTPQTRSFVVGDSVNFTCTSTGFPTPRFNWFRDGQGLVEGEKIMFPSPGVIVLKDLNREDAGQYECLASNPAGDDTKVAILNYMEAPKVKPVRPRMLFARGDTATLVCEAMGIPQPKITWFKGQQKLADLSFIQAFDSELYILVVQDQDAGSYTCVATNEAGEDSATIDLEIGLAPRSGVPFYSVGIDIHANGTLPCGITGDPPPQILWTHNNNKPVDDDRFTQLPDGSLFVQKALLKDEGLYICKARNELGEKQVTAQLSITGIIVPKITAYTNTIDIPIGHEVHLSCTVTEGNPQPTLMWIKNQEVLKDGATHIIDDFGNLRIRTVQPDDAGDYTCLASNIGGNATHTMRVSVQVPPSIEGHDANGDYIVIQGNPITLPCKVTGDPRPLLQWTKDGNRIPVTDPHYLIGEDGSLNIFSADPQDTAVYACTALNVAGITSKSMALTVHVRPSIIRDQDEYIVVIESPLIIPCIVNSVPIAAITWKKDGVVIRPDQGHRMILPDNSLEIESAAIGDVGLYECFASNVAGNASKVVSVGVQVPPKINSTGTPDQKIVVGGKPVILECFVAGDPPPKIRWQKNRIDINPYDPNNIDFILQDNGGLYIHRATPAHTATYTCIAENPAGVATRDIKLIIHEKPRIPNSLQNNTSIVKDKKAHLPCPASGVPPPTISWFKDGKPLIPDKDVKMLGDGTLEFSSAKAKDAGVYVCVATNIAGQTRYVIEFKVFVPPTFNNPVDGVDPRIPERPSVIVNNSITMSCPVNAIPPPQITWFKDGRPVNYVQNELVRITPDGRNITIPLAQLTDAGRFTCIARNIAGETEKNFDLEVLIPPKIDDNNRLDTFTVIVKRPIVLDCRVRGKPAPKITWMRDGVRIDLLDPNVRIFSQGRRIEIIESEVSHTGFYTCLAESVAGTSGKNYSVDVLVPPNIRDSSGVKRPSVIANDSIELDCTVFGVPVPEVTWYRDSLPINTSDPRIQILENGYFLKVSYAKVQDSARYSCRAVNIAGQSEKYFDLNILVPPEITRNGLDLNPSVIVDRSVVISCPATGVPPPDIIWYRDNQLLNVRSHPNLSLLAGGRQLRIMNSKVSDAAIFTCKVVNKAGEDSLDFDLQVYVPPRIDVSQISLLDMEVIVNRSVVIQCPATGIPAPVISWFHDGREINPAVQKHFEFKRDGRELKIDSVQVDNSGRYICRATNPAGMAEQTYHLNVLVPPRIDDTNLDRSPQIVVNRSISLHCPAYGTPNPEITWLRNGIPLSAAGNAHIRVLNGGKQIEITRAAVTDSARYTCIATNKAGTSDLDFDMDILVPPSIDGHIDTKPQVIKGRTMILNCPASGIPFPNITWMVDRNPIVESQRFKILAQGRQLEIISTQVVDSNRYTCLASNAAGQASKDFNVEVIVPPTIDEANLVDNPRVISNRTVILECPVSGIPPPTIKWLKDGVRLTEKKGLKVLSGGRQVEILHAAVIDTGRYTCIAANDAGELRRTFGLEVLVPPQIDDRLLDLNPSVIQNRSIYIDCPVTSIPQPSFLWSKNGEPLFDFPYPNLKLLNNGRQIHVVKAQVSDAADYTCTATNVAGQLSRTFKLQVLIPPKFNGSGNTLSLSVIKGHSVSIVCPAIGTPPPTVLWFRDGLPLLMELNPHMQLQDNDRILKILSSRVVDRARYACRAHNRAGEVERYFNLDVLVPPRINGSEKIQEMSVIVNRGTVISCPASGIPTPNIDWYWEGKLLTVLSNPNLHFLSGGRQLQIISAQLLDIGQYKCVASNGAGNASKEFILGVMVPPTIEDGPPIVQASLNARTLLLCETLGLPEPDIQWEKAGERIPNVGANYRMHRSGSLEFNSVTLEDSGNYRCTATNEAGSKFRDVRLEVQVPPTILSPSPYEMTVAVDSSSMLPCKTSGAPKPRITWQKGTSVLNGANGYSVEGDGSLIIQKAGLRDAGIYICIAQNNAGTALGQVRLEVEVPPKIEEQQKEYTVVQDREIILPCRSNGVPPPKVTWEKDGTLISQSDFRYRVLRSGWLAIPITRTQDTGRYKCIAENNAGKDTIEIVLTVQVPPHIEEAQRIFTVIQGDQATLLCRAKGVPPPTVIWYRDGRRIADNHARFKVLDTGSLQFADVQRSDGGSYICSASNQAGRDTEQIILRVQVPPSFTRIPQDQEVNANGRIELECAAEGIPIPVVSWQKNGTVIPAAPSINGRSRLKIENARKEDGGTYVCVAINPAGSGKVIAAVFVKVPPRVLNLDETRAVTLAEKVVLHCPVSGDPPLTIIWMKDGRTVQLDDRISQLSNGSLVIYDSVNSDAGEYKCVVTNDAGSSEGSATLTVQRPPDFSVEPKNTLIGQGETTIFNCVASGEPKPSIRWQKGRVRLSSGDRLTIMPNNSLRIVATQLEDAGVYVCIARNSRGSILVQAELTVQVHGGFSTWSAWGDCSVTCGQGTQFRSRSCDNPAPLNGGRNCDGGKKQSQTCFVEGCQADGQWGSWASWEECSMTCGEGERVRSRKCDRPAPAYGGEPCAGAAVEKAICNVRSCPIDGNWSAWSEWGSCSETCGQGTQERYRRCDSPQAQHGGRKCPGSELERRTCTVRNCETDGNWGQWQQWSSCSLSCGGGTRQRVRLCNNPPPSINGRFCPGEDLQKDYCNSEDCPVHGNWAAWGNWGECSATCGGGSRKRFRTCSDPPATNGGRTCSGQALSTEQCSPDECPVDSLWNLWGEWSPCSVTCDEGTRERSRTCTPAKFGGQRCLGDGKQVNKCQKAKCAAKTVRRAIGSVLGNINDRDFGISQLIADVVVGDEFTTITAKINKIPKSIGPLMQHLASILTPIYWTSAKEIGGAANGFTLTKGHFKREVQVEFATGEILRMTHVAQGIDKDGNLDLDIIVTGYVPDFPGSANIAVEPYTEEYIQTGPGSIYAYSSRIFRINGHSLPYAWNHSISYDPTLGKMPYLVESLQTDDINVLYDVDKETLEYQLKAFIMRGDPSNQCPDGFNLNTIGPYCEDSDECRHDPRPCSHYCHNAPGSYSCSCPFGLTLDADGKTCKDINECELRIARCHQGQECINTVGSYRCAVKCGDGFRRTSGGLSCQDINECQEEPNVCDQQCLNRIGSYRCACRRGYRLSPPNRCIDIDECARGSPCSHLCTNTAGSYQCSCPNGYRLLGGQECRDIDECSQGLHNCAVAQECRNQMGGFTCVDTCPNGLKRAKNGTCVDIDECALSRNQCFYNQICVNTVGSYHCKCPLGFISSGAGQPCVDINECALTPSPCAYRCRNLDGSYECLCPPGQKLLSDKKSCAGLTFIGPAQVDRADSDSRRKCPAGYVYNYNTRSCTRRFSSYIMDRAPRVTTCPPGRRRVNGRCIRKMDINNGAHTLCARGYLYKNGRCTARSLLLRISNMRCPPNQQLRLGRCMRINRRGLDVLCPGGYRFELGECLPNEDESVEGEEPPRFGTGQGHFGTGQGHSQGRTKIYPADQVFGRRENHNPSYSGKLSIKDVFGRPRVDVPDQSSSEATERSEEVSKFRQKGPEDRQTDTITDITTDASREGGPKIAGQESVQGQKVTESGIVSEEDGETPSDEQIQENPLQGRQSIEKTSAEVNTEKLGTPQTQAGDLDSVSTSGAMTTLAEANTPEARALLTPTEDFTKVKTVSELVEPNTAGVGTLMTPTEDLQGVRIPSTTTTPTEVNTQQVRTPITPTEAVERVRTRRTPKKESVENTAKVRTPITPTEAVERVRTRRTPKKESVENTAKVRTPIALSEDINGIGTLSTTTKLTDANTPKVETPITSTEVFHRIPKVTTEKNEANTLKVRTPRIEDVTGVTAESTTINVNTPKATTLITQTTPGTPGTTTEENEVNTLKVTSPRTEVTRGVTTESTTAMVTEVNIPKVTTLIASTTPRTPHTTTKKNMVNTPKVRTLTTQAEDISGVTTQSTTIKVTEMNTPKATTLIASTTPRTLETTTKEKKANTPEVRTLTMQAEDISGVTTQSTTTKVTEANTPKATTLIPSTEGMKTIRTPRGRRRRVRFWMRKQLKEVEFDSKSESEEECPKGYDMRDGVCIERTLALEGAPTAVICEPGLAYRNGRCLPVEFVPTQCRKGFEFMDGTCVLTVKVVTTPAPCASGYIFKKWKCLKEEVRKCGKGFVNKDGTCVPEIRTCGVGYELKNGSCVINVKKCDPGFDLVDGECVKKCGQGFELRDGKCARRDKQCPAGYEFKDGQCMMVNNPCPHGYAYIKNRCVRMGKDGPIPDDSNESEEKCGLGYKYMNGRCIPRMMLGEELPEVECPDGYEFKFGRCLDYDECQGPNPCQHQCRNTRGSYVCTCPPGYRLNANGRHCDDIDECKELNFNCGPDKKCNNVGGDFECVDHSCPKNYDRDQVSGFCVLECDKAPPGFECPKGTKFADILDFKEVSLPNGIPAYQDLIRLIAYNQFDVHLPRTTFTIIENHDEVPFGIRIQDGKGIVYTLEPLEHRKTYTITVRARSFDHDESSGLRYQTTFILHISVSAFPY